MNSIITVSNILVAMQGRVDNSQVVVHGHHSIISLDVHEKGEVVFLTVIYLRTLAVGN